MARSTMQRTRISRYTQGDWDVMVFRDEDYAVAVDKQWHVIAKSTDHASVIQSAIDNIGGIIIIKAGEYYLKHGIKIIERNYVRIVGEGVGRTFLIYEGSGNESIVYVEKSWNILLQDFNFKVSNYSIPNVNGIEIIASQEGEIRRVAGSCTGIGIRLANAPDRSVNIYIIDHVQIGRSDRVMVIDNDAGYGAELPALITIRDSSFAPPGGSGTKGVWIKAGSQIRIIRCDFDTGLEGDQLILGGAGQGVYRVRIDSCSFFGTHNATRRGIVINDDVESVYIINIQGAPPSYLIDYSNAKDDYVVTIISRDATSLSRLLTGNVIVMMGPNRNIKIISGSTGLDFWDLTNNRDIIELRWTGCIKIVQKGVNILVPSGATYIDISLPRTEPDTNYGILVTLSWNTTYWISNKTTTGFRIYFGTAPTSDSYLDWFLFR